MNFDGPNNGRIWLNLPLPFDYEIMRPSAKAPRELILLLHGYAESGKRILEKLRDAFADDVVVVAPNGPFPIPFKTDGGYSVVYTWYLYEPQAQEYFIDMRVAREHLKTGVEKLGFAHLPKRIVGFSQGGYLAPFVAHDLGGAKQVIGIGCEYLIDEWPQPIDFRIDGIHGAEDEINQIDSSRASFEKAKASSGAPGDFHVIAGTKHKVTSEVRDKVSQLLVL